MYFLNASATMPLAIESAVERHRSRTRALTMRLAASIGCLRSREPIQTKVVTRIFRTPATASNHHTAKTRHGAPVSGQPAARQRCAVAKVLIPGASDPGRRWISSRWLQTSAALGAQRCLSSSAHLVRHGTPKLSRRRRPFEPRRQRNRTNGPAGVDARNDAQCF